jgi:hypothetical protein
MFLVMIRNRCCYSMKYGRRGRGSREGRYSCLRGYSKSWYFMCRVISRYVVWLLFTLSLLGLLTPLTSPHWYLPRPHRLYHLAADPQALRGCILNAPLCCSGNEPLHRLGPVLRVLASSPPYGRRYLAPPNLSEPDTPHHALAVLLKHELGDESDQR